MDYRHSLDEKAAVILASVGGFGVKSIGPTSDSEFSRGGVFFSESMSCIVGKAWTRKLLSFGLRSEALARSEVVPQPTEFGASVGPKVATHRLFN